jgi:hypothetical protein
MLRLAAIREVCWDVLAGCDKQHALLLCHRESQTGFKRKSVRDVRTHHRNVESQTSEADDNDQDDELLDDHCP